MDARFVQFVRQLLRDVFECWMAAAIAEEQDWVAQQCHDGVFDGLPNDASRQQFACRLLLKVRYAGFYIQLRAANQKCRKILQSMQHLLVL